MKNIKKEIRGEMKADGDMAYRLYINDKPVLFTVITKYKNLAEQEVQSMYPEIKFI